MNENEVKEFKRMDEFWMGMEGVFYWECGCSSGVLIILCM